MAIKVIMIANQKGGVGKTTCAVELCTAFGKKGYKVLGIDLDPQNSFSSTSGADTTTGNDIKSVLDVAKQPDEVIQHLQYFDIIPGNEMLQNASVMYGETNDAWLLADAIDYLKEVSDYDYIIIDSAPARSKLLEMEYYAADYVIAPTESDPEAERGLYKIQKDIQEFSKHNQSHAKFLGVFMNKFNKRSNLHKAMYDNLLDIEEEIGTRRFESTIRSSVKAQEARLTQSSIEEYANSTGISEDFSRLVDEIINRIEEA